MSRVPPGSSATLHSGGVSPIVGDPEILRLLSGQQIHLVGRRLHPQVEQTSIDPHLAKIAVDRYIELLLQPALAARWIAGQ
jgi:hypothetical protein